MSMMSSTAPRVAPITQPVKNQAVPDCISKARNFRQPLVLQTRETARQRKQIKTTLKSFKFKKNDGSASVSTRLEKA